jgi:1-acyl-sn-glycerol-3-phosphate acyltransferase
MLVAFRLLLFVLLMAALPLQWLALKLQWPLMRKFPVWFHRMALRILNIRVEILGAPSATDRPLLFVSNHMSWLDIIVLGSTGPLVFIAKSEIANWPLFGTFARLQRSIFVDRAKRHGTGQVNQTIAKTLSGGDPVVLFGEGTSSDGNRVLPFRSALLGGLRDAMEENGRGFVQPVSIAYLKFRGIPMGRQRREIAAWYGDMDLVPHLIRVLREGAIDVTVAFGKVMEVAHADDRKALSQNVESAVRRLTSLSLAGRPELLAESVCLAGERR